MEKRGAILMKGRQKHFRQFCGKNDSKQESTAKEDGIAIMGNWQVKDDSGNSITIEFGSEIDITVKFN